MLLANSSAKKYSENCNIDPQEIGRSGIEISVQVPLGEKKKKGFDVEAYLKRQLARVQREVQVTSPTYDFFSPLKKVKLPPNTLAGFDLTTHRSSLLGGRRRRYH
jgi:hypothetical protein